MARSRPPTRASPYASARPDFLSWSSSSWRCRRSTPGRAPTSFTRWAPWERPPWDCLVGRRSPLTERRLADARPEVRVDAVRLLAAIGAAGSFGPTASTPLLLRALSDPSEDVRDVAALASLGADHLVLSAGPAAVPSFLKLLED